MPRRQPNVPLAFAAAAVLGLPGCATALSTGPTVTEERDTRAVTAVVLETSGDLVVTLGDTPRLEIVAGEDVVDALTSEVEGDTLTLGTAAGSRVRGSIQYQLTTPVLSSVSVRGSGTVLADLSGSTETAIEVEGSGQVDASNIRSGSTTVQIDGSGQVTVGGSATSQVVTIGGAGRYRGFGLESTDARVAVEGSGSAEVEVTGTLEATVDGSGSIDYRGGPQVRPSVTGSGTIAAA